MRTFPTSHILHQDYVLKAAGSASEAFSCLKVVEDEHFHEIVHAFSARAVKRSTIQQTGDALAVTRRLLSGLPSDRRGLRTLTVLLLQAPYVAAEPTNRPSSWGS